MPEDFDGFRLACIVTFGLDTQIDEEKFKKNDVNTLADQLYKEAIENYQQHKEEIRKLIGKTQQKGLTLIPTRMYFKNGRVKIELALAKGKQLWDKRETERRRTADKEAREAIARSRKK